MIATDTINKQTSVNLSGLPTPTQVADSPSARRHLLYQLGLLGQAMDEHPEKARTYWRALGYHAHGLLVTASEGTVRTPEWWLTETARLEAQFPGRYLREPLSYTTHRVADVISVASLREDWLSEITLTAYKESGYLKA